GVLALGYGLMAAGFAGLPSGVSVMILLISTSAIGAGFALAMPNFVDIALQIAPGRHRGLAASALTSAVFLGQFMSPFVSLPSISSFGFNVTFHGTAFILGALAVIAAGVRGAEMYRLLRSV
ncbi:MAG: MFS transporter, partial [Pseudomonadota bacterium]